MPAIWRSATEMVRRVRQSPVGPIPGELRMRGSRPDDRKELAVVEKSRLLRTLVREEVDRAREVRQRAEQTAKHWPTDLYLRLRQ